MNTGVVTVLWCSSSCFYLVELVERKEVVVFCNHKLRSLIFANRNVADGCMSGLSVQRWPARCLHHFFVQMFYTTIRKIKNLNLTGKQL